MATLDDDDFLVFVTVKDEYNNVVIEAPIKVMGAYDYISHFSFDTATKLMYKMQNDATFVKYVEDLVEKK